MYFYELFSHSDRIIYRAQLLSAATCVAILCAALTFLPPFLLTYYTGDFWPKESIYSEQPRLNDRIKYILIADTNPTLSNRFFTSSYATLNRNLPNNLISGPVSVSTTDIDGDGLLDQFIVSSDIIFPTSVTTIRGFNIWLIFQCEFRTKQRVNMETMALVNILPPSSFTPTSNKNLTVYGQLVLEQREPITSSGNTTIYNTSIINVDSVSLPDLDLTLENYFTRKYYTSFKPQYTWMTSRTISGRSTVTVNVVVNVGRQAIRYMPGFWQNFKWGWIQYICALVPFMIVFSRLKLFLFSNQLVQTWVPLPNHRRKA